MPNRVQKVAVVNCVLMLTVVVEDVSPDLAPKRALVLVQGERRLRNELQVDCGLVLHNLMIELGTRVVGAILQIMDTLEHF